MTVQDEIEIPVIEIGPGWTVDEIQTLDDCDDAHAYLTGALCSIENRIIECEETGDAGLGYRRLVSARRWKKAALSVVQTKRAKFNRAAREQMADDGRKLRDWFAAQWVAAGHHGNLTSAEAAEQAFDFADAMLAEREKRQ